MCGRFTIISELAAVQQEFDLDPDQEIWKSWTPRYNVAPTQQVAVIKSISSTTLYLMTWGLIPHWSNPEKDKSFALINARSESLDEKPAFRFPLQKNQRCLILANGFYEWQKQISNAHPKAPYYFYLKDQKPFVFAGLFNQHTDSHNQILETCTIITCAPNELIAPIHHRMPVIFTAKKGLEWLSLEDCAKINASLTPLPAELMQSHPVSQWVNNAMLDSPRCILPLNDLTVNS